MLVKSFFGDHYPCPMTKKPSKRRRGNKPADPHYAREAERYERPIPSREFILTVMQDHQAPIQREELIGKLGLDTDQDLEALERRLRAMTRDGQIICNRRGALCQVNNANMVTGRVIAHPDGHGFLKPDDGEDDLLLPARQMRVLFHEDRIVARVTGMDRRNRRIGALAELLERPVEQVVGKLAIEHGIGYLVPDNPRITHEITIPPDELNDAQEGQIVVAAIIEQPTDHSPPVGRISEVLGSHMAPGMEIEIAIRAHNLPHIWPEGVEAEAGKFGASVPKKARKGRQDLTDLPLVTIDGADSRDFDDAVYCTPTKSGWKLIVAIADVAAYVEPDSLLDKEAYKRGNSVYFPDNVIPMLPEALSNGLCSLNPNVDRLSLCCEAIIDPNGKIVRSRFYDAVIRSHARLTYSEVAAVVEHGDKRVRRRLADVVPHLDNLYSLYQVLRARREKRGAIDFSSTETQILFDSQRKIERIEPRERHESHKLIEECMLVANVSAARFLRRHKMPTLYRIHETPSGDKLEELHEFLAENGLRMGGGKKPQPRDFNKLIHRIADRPDARLIETVLLRSMMQAVYSPDNIGHFGLAFDEYLHFTSPIRRYPDLLVHRAIRHIIHKGKPSRFRYNHGAMQQMGEHCSTTERRADDATNEAVSWLKCEFMLDHVGDDFDGTITGVTGFGLFVELDQVFIDGLVHITSLDNDYYRFDPVGHRLEGERSGQSFRLTDRVRVRVAAVNLDDRKIDLQIINLPKAAEKKDKKKRKRRRKR